MLSGCEETPQGASIRVSAAANMMTTEEGAETSFTIVLTSLPSGNVEIPLRTDNQNEGVISTDKIDYFASVSVLFTPYDWHIPKTIYVKGLNDNISDGNVLYHIVTDPALSDDGVYQSMDANDIKLTNYAIGFNTIELPSAELVVTPVTPLTTSEDGNKSAIIALNLNRQPIADVTVSIGSLDPTEGLTQPNQPELIVFTSADWAQAKTVTVAGVDDQQNDGDILYQLSFNVVSTDLDFNNLLVAPLSILNEDNDLEVPGVAAVIVSPTAGLLTNETPGSLNTASFSLSVNTSPAVGESVTINALVSDTSEATISPANVVFSSANWQTSIPFTLSGVDDSIVDGSQSYTVSFSVTSSLGTGSIYDGIAVANVQASNTDNDVASVTTTLPVGGITTSENQASASIDLVLDTAPSADVIISATSLDATEGTVTPASLTFSPGGSNAWNQTQSFTVTGVNDDILDGAQAYLISLAVSSIDVNFNNLTIPDISATNNDNDTASVSLSLPVGGVVTSEDAGSDTFSVVLDSAPLADVIISATSLDLSEATVTPASLTFSTSGAAIWNQAQSFTVTGVNDDAVDGIQVYNISLLASSTDSNYNNLAITDVTASNTDNDFASISMNVPVGGIVTSEDGSNDTFSLVLDAAPLADVIVSAASLDLSEGTISPSNLTFSTSGATIWNQAQSFTVTGIDDSFVDGDQTYNISLSISSADSNFSNLTLANVAASNIDNDVAAAAGVSLNLPNGGIVTSEIGSSSSFTVVLDSEPSADVTISVSSLDTSEGRVSPSSVRFSPSGEDIWNQAQTITVIGQSDDIADDNRLYLIAVSVTSADQDYDSLSIANIQAINVDIDSDSD